HRYQNPGGGPIALPTDLAATIKDGFDGKVTIMVQGLDSFDAVVASGNSSTTVTSGKVARAQVNLIGEGFDGGTRPDGGDAGVRDLGAIVDRADGAVPPD